MLFRVNAQSETYEQALTEAGVPYQVRGGERFFQRPEIRRAHDASSAMAGGRAPTVAAGRRRPRRARAASASARSRPAAPAQRAQWESLLALVELAEELAARRAGRRPAPLRRRARAPGRRARTRPPSQGVTLASLHAAKGLEWDAVFLVGLVDGTLPIQHADGDEHAIEEERRLFYVGVTRARRQVVLSWALARQPGGARRRRRSRFLYGLVPEHHPASRIAVGERRRGQAAVAGSAVRR